MLPKTVFLDIKYYHKQKIFQKNNIPVLLSFYVSIYYH